jgi:transcriptional regulator with XRE-family HTH domain
VSEKMTSVEVGEVIKRRRVELGLSQAQLAAAVGVDQRQIRRYESGRQQPLLSVAVAIAKALKISLNELAGIPPERNLTGSWWASWQTVKDGAEVVMAQELQFIQQADVIQVHSTTPGLPVEKGGYHWRGELRLWDDEVLTGWYAANDDSARSKGTMYFVLRPDSLTMAGRWVGLSHDGDIVTGWGGVAKTEDEARAIIDQLKEHCRPQQG